MRVFITGGTGYLGSAVTAGLVSAGHEVSGLVRSDKAADVLVKLGGTPIRGDVTRPQDWLSAAAECDAVLHLAQHPGSDRSAADRLVVSSLLDQGKDSLRDCLFIYTSVLFVLGDSGNEMLTEVSAPQPGPYAAARAEIEQLVLAAGRERLATAVIRPGMVYGGGNGGAVSELFRSAHEEGAAAYVGSGNNRWSPVHREDVAALYIRVLEQRARGVFHAVDEQPVPVRELAREASRAAGAAGAVKQISLDDARGMLGDFADALCLDQNAAAPRSRELGWRPAFRDFLSNSDAAFAEWKRQP